MEPTRGLMDFMALLKHSNVIYKKLEPLLVKIAAKQRMHDPQGETRSWSVRLQEILHGFDTGRYVAREAQVQGAVDTFFEGVAPGFNGSVAAYLLKAFSHDMMKLHRSESSTNYEIILEKPTGAIDETEIALNQLLFNQIFLSDLIDLIGNDLARANKLASSVRDHVNRLFLAATVDHYEEMFLAYGDLQIAKDLDARIPADFFIKDILDARVDGIKLKLALQLEAEPHLTIKIACKKLLSGNGSYALAQKISRYFLKLPHRLSVKISNNRKI